VSEQLAAAQGVVTIGPASFVVKALPFEEEVSLRALMRAKARDAWGPGSFYAQVMPAAKFARENGEHRDADLMVQAVAPLIAMRAGASEDATDVWRRTPDGVAFEVYHRTRDTHPDCTLQEIRAVVNEVNAGSVFAQVARALDPGK